mmetsp:Transcript_46448/g.51946  ORF Transcript_46448/g.51946 Transcript_46448/m.51946 type:complete len:366 (+) Transcript_46448:49-1146(+)
MSPSNHKLNKRSIDCISGRSSNDTGICSSSSIDTGEINNSNKTWNNNEHTQYKTQQLNLLTTLNMNLNLIPPQTSSSVSLHSSNASLQSLISSSGNTTNHTNTTSVVAHSRFVATFPQRHSSARPAPSMIIPVLSPCTYMTISLQNKKIKPRIDSFSIEQALFFEPYQESTIQMELLQALRSSNLDQLKSYQQVKSGEQQQQQQQDQDEKEKKIRSEAGDEKGVITDDDGDTNSCEKNTTSVDLKACNQFGENLLHLACRIGICQSILEFLLEEAHVALNVRDRFGRTPLHNACMSAHPNFQNIDYLISTQPRMVLFEDDKGKVPFDLIPHRCYEQWTRFLSEKNILQRVVAAELEWNTKKGEMF